MLTGEVRSLPSCNNGDLVLTGEVRSLPSCINGDLVLTGEVVYQEYIMWEGECRTTLWPVKNEPVKSYGLDKKCK